MEPECIAKLTEKQRACLRLVLMHYSSKEIARELRIGVDAVDQRLKSAMKNLGVQNRIEAARMLAEYEGHPTVAPARKSTRIQASGPRRWFRWLSDRLGKWKPRTRRARFIFWTCLLATIAGGEVDLWFPLEELLRDQRTAMRRHPASGDIVVIGIDNRTTDKLGHYPIPRTELARLVQQLDRLGAERIAITLGAMSRRTTPTADAALAAALQSVGYRAVLFVHPDEKEAVRLPLPEFRKNATLVHSVYLGFFGPRAVPFHEKVDGRTYPSMAYKLAGYFNPIVRNMLIDYAVEPDTIPIISAIDIIEGRVTKDKVERKIVLIGDTGLPVLDGNRVPGYGITHQVISIAISIETLKSGMIQIPWWVTFAPALIIAFLSRRPRSHIFLTTAYGGSILILLVVPYFLERATIFIKIMPPLSVLVPIGAGFAFSALRRRLRNGGTVAFVDSHNPSEGAKA